MNNLTTNYIRMNISLPKDLVKELKENVSSRGISRFLATAAKEKIKTLAKEKALKELLAAPPAFTNVKDSLVYIRKMRRLDNKRLRRLGI